MKKQTIVIGVTSGIAAYRSIELVRILREEGYDIFVVMTEHATKMVAPKEFKEVSSNKVYSELFEQGFTYKDILKMRKVDHIKLADAADIIVIVPATANIIAKIAHGIADDFLTTTLLATHAPVLVCPSMNVNMWNNPIVQENITKLRVLGYHIIEPEKGMLACGYEGKGRLAHIQTIKNEVVRHSKYKNSLVGKKIIVTAGGTLEKIDDVRYITNRSSGKMGVAIAEECFVRGADVLLLRAKHSVIPRYAMQEKVFKTASDLYRYIKENILNYDIIFHVAAVSDFRVKQPINEKLSSNTPITLELVPTEKIIDHIKGLNPKIKLIAFKADHNLRESDIVALSKQKFEKTFADAIVANDIGKKGQGFEADFNEVIIVFLDSTYKKVSLAPKQVVAREIIDTLVNKCIL